MCFIDIYTSHLSGYNEISPLMNLAGAVVALAVAAVVVHEVVG